MTLSTYTIKSANTGIVVTKYSTSEMLAFVGKMHTTGLCGTYVVTSNKTGGVRAFTSLKDSHAMLAKGSFAV